jgi:hypothetical protein
MMSNKRNLNNHPRNNWIHLAARAHIDEGEATCGECNRKLHNFLGVTEGMLEYKCECGWYNFVTPICGSKQEAQDVIDAVK